MEKIHKIDSNICENLLHVFEERTIRDTSKCNYTDLDWQVHELTDQVFIIRAGKLAGEHFTLTSKEEKCAQVTRTVKVYVSAALLPHAKTIPPAYSNPSLDPGQ